MKLQASDLGAALPANGSDRFAVGHYRPRCLARHPDSGVVYSMAFYLDLTRGASWTASYSSLTIGTQLIIQALMAMAFSAQPALLPDYLNGGRWKLIAEFTEFDSGKRNHRPELEKALAACKKRKAKLVIAKLDRLSRNVHFTRV
jgi:hypothetical protein